ncbi:TIGR02270 family protein [Roseateles sp. SL47]|uniref:TIGR02270 family protein n=1 Tax=Roseateles sp. SL47 TaxID=2995138 RepID=UPI00226EFD04|nr:TIGR02270 family protein [Roseateles sp. SL47]WAC72249.1 TIGR02270 family protein [Roseateles sp. SL47]
MSAAAVTFRPGDVSALIHRGVVAEHASSASFLWLQREVQVRAPHVAVRHLARVDGRLLAHLRGLELAGHCGWDTARRGLSDADAGVCFVLGYLAFGQGDEERMVGALRLALADPRFEAGVLDALRWLEVGRVGPRLQPFLHHEHPTIRRLMLAARCFHRMVDDAEVGAALTMPDVSVRITAVETAGALRMRALRPQVDLLSRDSHPGLGLAATLALAALGDAGPLMQRFHTMLSDPASEPLLARAIPAVFQFCTADWAVSTIRRLAADSAATRLALLAVGTWGDPATMPWLLSLLEGPQARQVGEAYALMTGVDLRWLDLHRDPPDAEGEPDEPMDAELPWPDADAVRGHWKQIAHNFRPGVRYLAGQPVTRASAVRLLRDGYQRQRLSAAWALMAQDPDARLFPVHARADLQAGWLRS